MWRANSGQIMSLCEHLTPGPYPFDITLVLDDHLGPTEALIRCRSCQRHYLLEMLDWRGDQRLFRLSQPFAAATEILLKDLARGSCDLNRATEEVRQFSLASTRLPVLLLVDARAQTVLSLSEVAPGTHIPGTGWRDLPCDGSWIEGLQDRL